MNSTIDFGFAWNWEYDRDLARILAEQCRMRGLEFLSITPENLDAVISEIERGAIRFRTMWDRASDSDSRFLTLINWARANTTVRINRHEMAAHAWNKATMHLEFISSGVYTPYTIVLDPYHVQPVLREIDLDILGPRFIIKPAHGGGGVGVILDATGLERVLAARREHPDDYYLLQKYIEPIQMADRPAWFRVIYACGRQHWCWWDVKTHIYTSLSDIDKASLPMPLFEETLVKIAGICGLDVFSSEFALTNEQNAVVVDYINDPLDLRLKSVSEDGVPDSIVHSVAESVVATAEKALIKLLALKV
ncbi:MAG: hypothetical protein V1681_10030 [Candidatus Neomarinimicrobiota bacterium]